MSRETGWNENELSMEVDATMGRVGREDYESFRPTGV